MKDGAVPPAKHVDAADRQSFRCPKDVVHPSGYFVEKSSKMNHISVAFSPRIRTDGLTPFPPNYQVLGLMYLAPKTTRAHYGGTLL
ncbi:hypothetical protein QBD01_004486 [Ochrobactrum sp. 19YEA23]|nr:hypothetical protein [Ochrobactrum sp. 19YEA23]